jgi:hypothetical protein
MMIQQQLSPPPKPPNKLPIHNPPYIAQFDEYATLFAKSMSSATIYYAKHAQRVRKASLPELDKKTFNEYDKIRYF